MGLLRLVLALFVVAQHLGGFRFVGASAVQVFFILSGYLMTSVMIRSYGFSASGFGRFWANRILRLYPGYLVVLLLTVLVIQAVGEPFVATLTRSMALPDTLWSWFENITMLFASLTPIEVLPRLSPPTWALTLELACYFLISLGITRSPRMAVIWLVIGAGVLVWALFFSGHPKRWGYSSIPAAFLPFALGGLLFHLRNGGWCIPGVPFTGRLKDPARAPRLLLIALGGIVALAVVRLGLFWATRSDLVAMLPYVLNMALGVTVVLAALEWRPAGGWLAALDRLAGDIAYPVYLAHWMVAIAVAAMLPGAAEVARGPLFFAICLLPVLGFSIALALLVDRPINSLRDRVRPTPDLRQHKA